MPILDAGVRVEPGELEVLDFALTPAESSSQALHAGQVIRPVNTSLTFISPGELSSHECRMVLLSPDSSAVKVMNVKSISKGLLERGIVCFPCYNLRVGAGQIAVE